MKCRSIESLLQLVALFTLACSGCTHATELPPTIGPIPTYQISWDQPHEGNLFEHLYRQRAFQTEPAA